MTYPRAPATFAQGVGAGPGFRPVFGAAVAWAFASLVAGCAGHGRDASGPSSLSDQTGGPPGTVLVRAIRASDDDGGRQAETQPEDVAAWVDYASRAFGPAGLTLGYDGQLLDLRSTVVNSISPESDVRAAQNVLAPLLAQHQGELVVITRHGPGRAPTGQAYASAQMDYVVMPGFASIRQCGHLHPDTLAHELGHFLGLAHTHKTEFRTVAEAAAAFQRAGGNPLIFDGDGLSDTPPDPGIGETTCGRVPFVDLAGVRLPLPLNNVMSYYDGRMVLTAGQLDRARWMIAERRARGWRAAKNRPMAPLEAERMRLPPAAPCRVQHMTDFGDGSWSGNAQLHCSGPVELGFNVRQRGSYLVIVYGTRSNDFATVEITVDGRPIGGYEGAAPTVLPTGPLTLGPVRLGDGDHRLGVRPVGRAPRAQGMALGIDAFELVPQ